jgi:multidrug resistance protein
MAENPQCEQERDDPSMREQVQSREPDVFSGNGTFALPFIVEFTPNDPHNPMNFTSTRKWLLTSITTISVFAITLTSSAYSGSAKSLMADIRTTTELFSLGIALFVLGFAVGPALWAPLSELYGRRILFLITHAFVVAFVAATAGCENMTGVLILRFLAGMFGASPLTNTGGLIADLFPPASRGLAMSIFAVAPFMGPVLGPILGGFVSENVGWRWVQGICAIFIGAVWIVGSFFVPETYGPVILREKAKRLSQKSGNVYVSILEVKNGGVEVTEVFGKALKRPWVLLFGEPIVLIASTYMSILYGTIYMFMGAFPIVYSQDRGWSPGIGGLAFLGLAVGMLLGLLYTIMDNARYAKLGKFATPESRLPPGMIGAISLPVGMFAFAWTSSPTIHVSTSNPCQSYLWRINNTRY